MTEQNLFDDEEIARCQKSLEDAYTPKLTEYIRSLPGEDDEPQKFVDLENIPTPEINKFREQNLFDVDAFAEEQEKKKQEEHHAKVVAARSSLVLPHYDNPKNENEMLFNYQYEYLHENKESAWGKMIELAFDVCLHLIWKRMKAEKLILDEVDQNEKASVAMEYVLRRFQNNIGYCCTTNFITLLDGGVTHALKYSTKEDEVGYIADLKTETNFKKIWGK